MPRDWSQLMRITLLWLAVYVAAVLFDRNLWVVSPYGRVESLCWLVILSSLVSVPAIRAFIGGLPRAHRIFCAAAIGALLFGQFSGITPERTFPVVPWRMFGSADRTVQPFTFFELVGDTKDGRLLPVNAVRLFPSLKNFRMTVSLNRVIEQGLDEGAARAQRATNEQRLREMLAAIGRVYNEHHPDDVLRSLGVLRCYFDPALPHPETRITRERAFTVDLAARAL
jgi:hypothetical protein